jgi:hypothetical protein
MKIHANLIEQFILYGMMQQAMTTLFGLVWSGLVWSGLVCYDPESSKCAHGAIR